MLDKRQPQVLIEVTLVTIDTSGGRSLGVELSRRHDTTEEDYELMFSAFGLSEIDQDTGVLTLTPGVGFNGVMINADTLNVVIRALATSGDATVLSAPKVLVNDNADPLEGLSKADESEVRRRRALMARKFWPCWGRGDQPLHDAMTIRRGKHKGQ